MDTILVVNAGSSSVKFQVFLSTRRNGIAEDEKHRERPYRAAPGWW